jgi:two-component system response regulator AtoC
VETAGFPNESVASGPFADEVLNARLEALKLLADHLPDPLPIRVLVLGPDLRIVYSNEPEWTPAADLESARPALCYEVIGKQIKPCNPCPAMHSLVTGETASVPAAPGRPFPCGISQAFPLKSSRNETQSVLVLLHPPKGAGRAPAPEVDVQEEREEERLGDLIGRSPAMRQMFEMIRLVADSQATVLLQGESGTGKELVAKTIHRLSARCDRPFVVIDCGSLPEALLESELFGHVRGAFTGAVSSKRGLFEEADGGTIFLDEVADTSLQFQAKLLRVLQEGEIKPVGSNQRIKVDVRVISASNKDLLDLVKAKAFRQDLYYRLAVLPLFLPPLRERREDIPLLVRHFVAVSCTRHRQPVRVVTPEAMRALANAPWPGNVRELQHVIERAVVTTGGSELTCKDIAGLASLPPSGDLRTVSRSAAEQAERARILEALQEAGGNRVKAARLLKISRASLYNKLRAYGIDRE